MAKWLVWLAGNCGRISAIGSSPSNGLKPNLVRKLLYAFPNRQDSLYHVPWQPRLIVMKTKMKLENGSTNCPYKRPFSKEHKLPLKHIRKEGNVLFNNPLNTFYLQLYGISHMVKDHSDSKRGNLLPPHGLLFLISSKGSFICIVTQTG